MSAYTELYLSEAMYNMAEMFEYAVNSCHIEPGQFKDLFLISGYAQQWEKGNPVYIMGRSGTELAMDVMEKCRFSVKAYEAGTYPKPIPDFHPGDIYWCGWILAYYQWSRSERFISIFRDLTFDDLLDLYPAGHTASEDRTCELIDQRRNSHRQIKRLQAYRQALGMTQSELARISGVNLRTLQEYETGRKSLQQASAQKVIHLANALHVQAQDLLEN